VHGLDTPVIPVSAQIVVGFEFFVGDLVFEKRLRHSRGRPAPRRSRPSVWQRSVIASDLPLPTHTTVLAMSPESEEGAKSRAARSGQFDFELITAGALRE